MSCWSYRGLEVTWIHLAGPSALIVQHLYHVLLLLKGVTVKTCLSAVTTLKDRRQISPLTLGEVKLINLYFFKIIRKSMVFS